VKSTADILMKQGIEQNQKTIITSMSGEGLSIEQIHKLTKIPALKITEILNG